MSDLYTVKEKMHKMRAKLYPSTLQGSEGSYIARTVNESSVTVEDICASMKNRGGYAGGYEDALQTVRHFLTETVYQLADGFSANLGYFSVHPNIGGVFAGEKEAHDHAKHPISFRFQALKPMRDIRGDIEVIIEGIADTRGYITDYTDAETGAVKETLTPSNQFVITGYKIKIEGDDPEAGIYFKSVSGGGVYQVSGLAENASSKLIGMTPACPAGTYTIVIKTQFSGAPGKFLKDTRTIESGFALTV
jgi:hypothetical protein